MRILLLFSLALALTASSTAQSSYTISPALRLTDTMARKITINLRRAAAFDKKNTLIAGKLGLPAEQLHFYLCSNYQEALRLMGYTYDLSAAGKTRDGYGVEANTIFATMGNEDFSHDLFHFYAEK